LIKNSKSGNQVLTVSAHCFDNHDDNAVYHPEIDDSFRIGIVTKLDKETDWGFVILDSNVNFSNNRYFTSPSLGRFVTAKEVLELSTQYSFFAANGFMTRTCYNVRWNSDNK